MPAERAQALQANFAAWIDGRTDEWQRTDFSFDPEAHKYFKQGKMATATRLRPAMLKGIRQPPARPAICMLLVQGFG